MPDRKNHETPTLEKWPKICVETYSPTNAVARKIPEPVLPYKGCIIPCVAWPSVPSEFNNSSTISCNSSSSSSDAIGIIALPVISGRAHESPLAPVFSGWESGAWESSVAAADRKVKFSKMNQQSTHDFVRASVALPAYSSDVNCFYVYQYVCVPLV